MTPAAVDQRRHAFKAVMNALNLSINAWANAAGINEKTLRNFISGATNSLREDTAARLTDAARTLAAQSGHNIDALLGGNSPLEAPTVWVLGLIGSGGVVSKISSVRGPVNESEPGNLGLREPEATGFHPAEGLYEVRVPPGLPTDRTYLAYELRGYPMPPCQDRWVVYVEKLNGIHAATIVGQACVVETADRQTLFRIVRKGYSPGRFNLESWDGSAFIEDAELISAHPYVGSLRPDIARV